MSISGSLVDASVPEVIQFVYLGRSTGTLALKRGQDSARLGFHEGDIINAWFTGLPRLGDVLVQRELIDRDTVEQLVQAQSEEEQWLSLGSMLVERELLSVEALHELLTDFTRKTVFSLMNWKVGSFEFTRGVPAGFFDLEQVENSPSLNSLKVRSEGVLLEAAHYLDESARRASSHDGTKMVTSEIVAGWTGPKAQINHGTAQAEEAASNPSFELRLDDILDEDSATPNSVPAAKKTRETTTADGVSIATNNGELEASIRNALDADQGLLARLRGGIANYAIIDLTEAPTQPGGIASLMPVSRFSGIIGIIGDLSRAAEAYAAGVTLATSDQAEDIIACLASITQTVQPATTRQPSDAVTRALDRLRSALQDMNGGDEDPNVALNLMNLVGEVVERAILLAVTDHHLEPIGAFGFSVDQRPLAIATSRLKFPLEGGGALESTASDGVLRTMNLENAKLPESLREILGDPVHDLAIVLPVRGVGEILAVVYADNGSLPTAIDQIGILEIACGQVGVALENQSLRRELREARAR